MASTVAITGATGFIGSRLVGRLRAEGRELRCLVRASSRTQLLRKLGAVPHVVDLESGAGLGQALEGVEAVLHLAGAVRAWRPADYERANVVMTRSLAEHATRAGVARIVVVSSLAAAGPSSCDEPRTESQPPGPVCDYGRSKLEAERALTAAIGQETSYSIIRPSAVYGPGDRDFLALFRLCAGRGRIVPYAAAPGARLSMVHVDDVVELVLRALDQAPRGSEYFCSDGGSYTWADVIEAMGAALGRKPVPLRLPPALLAPAAWGVELLRPFRTRPPVLCLDKLRQARCPAWLCSPARAERELGFRPRVGLEEGIAQTARWYREAGWLPRPG